MGINNKVKGHMAWVSSNSKAKAREQMKKLTKPVSRTKLLKKY